MTHFIPLKWAKAVFKNGQSFSEKTNPTTFTQSKFQLASNAKSFILAVFSILLFTATGMAQIDTNRFKVDLNPEQLGTCGGANNSLEQVHVLGKNASCHDFSITFALPAGVNYESGTASITSQIGSGDFVLTESGTANQPIFTIQRPSDANWQVGDEVFFSFERSADCDAVVFLNSGGIFKDAHTINFVDAGGNQSNTDDDITVSSYSLLAASLNISTIPTTNANVGETYTRDITLAQGGNGCTDNFTYYVTVGTDVDDIYELAYAGTTLVPTSVTSGVYTYNFDMSTIPFLDVGDKDGCFDNGEAIVLQETFRVDDCINTDILHNSFWGCSAGETCQAAAQQTGSLNFGANVPAIDVTRIGSATTELCGAVPYTVKIENTNTTIGSMAIDVAINLGQGANSSPTTTASTNPLWAWDYNDTRDVSNFRFGTNPSFTPTTLASTSYPARGSGSTVSIPPNFFTTDPDGPGGFEDLDNDGFFDDLPPGASTELTFDFAVDPRDNCGTGRFDYMSWEHTYFDVNFKDQCKSDRLPERIDLNYFNIIRDYQSVTEVEAPTDVVDAEDFVVSIAPSFYVGGTGAPACGGSAMNSNAASSEWSVTITVPAGMTLQPGAPAEFVQVGNDVTYTTTAITSGNYKEWVDFPLTLTCGPNGVQTIPYTTNYKCTGPSGVCWDQDVHCGSVQIYTHCPGGCSGPGITSFDANRTTPGWTDSSQTTLVTLDDNVHETKKYLAGDNMKLVTTATINNISLDNLYLDIEYHTLNAAAGGADIINFIDGTITINDISGNSQSGAITVAPVLTTNGTTDHMLTLDLSSYRSFISGTYEYGEGLDSDTIEIELNFEFAKDFSDISYFELSTFRGEFYAFTDYPLNTAKVSCDTWGDRAYYSRPRIYGSNQARSTNGCTPEVGILYFTHNMASADLFPDEYRPVSIWKSTVVEIPEGARFTGNVTSVSFLGAYSTATGEFIATENNGIITITPGPGFVDRDQRALHYPRFYVEFIGTCNSPASTTYDYTVNFDAFPYSATPENTSFTNTNTFNYTQPTFLMQSPFPTVNGDANTVDLDVVISNTSPEDVNYNWIQVTVPNGLNITGAYTVAGGVETSANYHLAAGKAWVEAGAITTGGNAQVRLKANFSDCSDQTVLVEHGWDCAGYPGYPDLTVDVSDFQSVEASCYQRSTSITLEPKEAQVQMAITDQPSTPQDLCTPFNIELDVISAQIADLINPYVEFSIPGGSTGMTIQNVDVEYPKNSSDIQPVSVTITNNIARLNLIDHTAIAAIVGILGNPAVNTSDQRTAHIDMQLQLECDFISNSLLTFKVYGQSPCGDPALGNGLRSVSAAIQANGAVAPYNALSTINLPGFGAPIDGCAVQETINVVTTITGGTSGSEDYGLVTLIPGIEYVPNTFTANGASIATFESISTVGDHQEMIVKYPAGVLDTETIDFDFDIITLLDGGCEASAEVQIVNYVVVNGITCSTGNCASFQVATGFSYEVLPLEKPVIEVAANNAGTFVEQTNGSFDYTVDIDFTNAGGADAAAGYTYTIYCDDGTGIITGPSIGTGTLSSAIAEGATVSEILTFNSSTALCSSGSIIVEFLPSSNCMCEPLLVVVPVSASPIADNDSSTGNPTNTAVSINVVGNDNDPDGNIDPTTVSFDPTSVPGGVCDTTDANGDCTQVTVPGEGVWTVDPAGLVTFTPVSGFTDDPSVIEYTVEDNDGNESNEATITIDYDVQLPVADNDSSTGGTTGDPVSINVVGNDNDPDGNIDPTTVSFDPTSVPGGVCDTTDANGDCTQVTVPGEGVWTVDPAGLVTFTPVSGFTDDPSVIEYTVEDNDGNESNEATITIDYDVQLPVADNDSSTGGTTGDPVSINVVGNDNDPDGTIDPTTVSFDPTSVPGGVCDTTDANGDCTQVTVPGEGVWTVDPAGLVTFTPVSGFTDDPSVIEYTVEDNDGNESNEATITIDYDVQLPVADNDSSTGGTTGDPVSINVVGNDNDPDGTIDPTTVSFDPTSVPGGVCDTTDANGDCTQVTVPGEGVWTVDPAGLVTFTPVSGFTDDPSVIEYTVEDNDGNESNEATITIDYDVQLPVADNDSSTGGTTGDPVSINVVGNDNDPDGTIDPTTVSFDPTSVPGGVCDTTDANGDCTQVTVPGEGVWTVDPAGLVTFTPVSGFTDDPSVIEYTVEDNDGNESNEATITIDYDVQLPVADNDSSTGGTTGDPVSINVVGNDNDPDGTIDPTTVSFDPTSVPGGVCDTTDANGDCTQVTVPGEGVWTVDPAGLVTFTPVSGFTDDPSVIEYTVEDNDGNESNEATITIDYDVQLPVADNDSSTGGTTGDPVSINVVGNDNDPDGTIDPTTVSFDPTSVPGGVCDTTDANGDCTQVTVPGEGVWTVDPAGLVTFTPVSGFTDDPSVIEYTVEDNDGNESNEATITIDYDVQLPVADNDSSTGGTTGDPVSINVVGNDNDPDGTIDPTTVSFDPTSVPGGVCDTTDANGDCTQVTVPGEGVWTVDPAGLVTFTPVSGFTDDPSVIEYTVEDNDGNESNEATITIDYDQCNGLGTADCDGDGISNEQEVLDGTDPNNPCDSIGGTPPAGISCDADGDGVLDDQEILDGTDPNNPCDFMIANITETQTGLYLLADCDGDGVTNGQEIVDGTNPEDPCDFDDANITLEQTGDYLISDCDGDGVLNGTEISDGTDPADPCDFVATSITLDRTGDWLDADCDADGITNGQEITDGTNPYEPCSAIGGTTPDGVVCDIVIESDLIAPGINDGLFQINNIESYPENTVRIYNRWGILVFETKGYDNANNAFRGISNGRVTIKQSDRLPAGVYFYLIDYVNDGVGKTKNGYLYVNL